MKHHLRPTEIDLITECIDLLDNCILACKKMTEISVSTTAEYDARDECKDACEMCLQCCLECQELFTAHTTDICKDEACKIFFKELSQLAHNVIKSCGSVVRALDVDKDYTEECTTCISDCDSFAEACERLTEKPE